MGGGGDGEGEALASVFFQVYLVLIEIITYKSNLLLCLFFSFFMFYYYIRILVCILCLRNVLLCTAVLLNVYFKCT